MAALANLSRGLKIFLAVDLVLLLGLLVAVAVVLGGRSGDGGTASPSAPSAQAATDGATDGASGATSDTATSFASPTGNIACTMSPDGVSCTIANKQYDVPASAGCTGTTGHTVVLNEQDGVTTPCVEGPAPAPASADTPVLEYGQTQTVGPYTCTSASNGMSCVVDETGDGFRVATAALTTLPLPGGCSRAASRWSAGRRPSWSSSPRWGRRTRGGSPPRWSPGCARARGGSSSAC